MKPDYKQRREAKHVEQKAAKLRQMKETGDYPSFNHWLACQSPESLELRHAEHELGHAAMMLPSSEWHIAFGDYADCPACKNLPPLAGALPLYAHLRNLTATLRQHTLDPFEVLYYSMAGGACEVACFPAEPVPHVVVPGTYRASDGTFIEGMADDFQMLSRTEPSLLPFSYYAYVDLYNYFGKYRESILSYAELLRERRVIYHHDIVFPFDPAEVRFKGRKKDPAYSAHMSRKCYMCGQGTLMWGFCIECRSKAGEENA